MALTTRAVSRWLLRFGALAFFTFGVVAFFASTSATGSFPWQAGPFLTMTIGGWALGTSGVGVLASRDVDRAQRHPLLIYLAAFAVGELVVAALFADRLRLGAPLTYPYLVAMSATALGAGLALLPYPRRHEDVGDPASVPPWVMGLVALFAVIVAGLCIATIVAGPDGMAARGLVVPEVMGVFSIRAFSAFFLAIALASLSLLATRDARVYDELGQAGLVLLLPITAAALVHLDLFDTSARPASLIYLGAYVIVGALLALRVLRRRMA